MATEIAIEAPRATTSTNPKPSTTSSMLFPFATAPDIIRAHQKDAYFQGLLTNQIADLHRRLRGARAAHSWATETQTAADLVYLCLTTLLGNRTLGEEYCELLPVEVPGLFGGLRKPPAATITHVSATGEKEIPLAGLAPVPLDTTPQPPSLERRALYIATSVLAPYLAQRLLPSLRTALRSRLRDRLATLKQQGHTETLGYRARRYVLAHLSALTSGAHAHALTLAVFYFTGAYYSLGKRVAGLRYLFTGHVPDVGPGADDGRGGYEVLGVLLVVQLAARAYLHVRAQLAGGPLGESEAEVEATIRASALSGAGRDVSLDDVAYASNNALLVGGDDMPLPGAGQRGLGEIGATMHTPVVGGGRARYLLVGEGGGGEDAVMGWIKGAQQRKCTLCLEELKDPAATQCGHVFCWTCIGDWVREKPECPLCRREAMVQHILPLRVA